MKKSNSKSDPVFQFAEKQVSRLIKTISVSSTSASTLSSDAIHEIRLCTKNLRALLPLYQPYCTKKSIKFVDRLIKAIADTYSKQRDAEVQLGILSQAKSEIGHQSPDHFELLLSYFSTRREEAEELHTFTGLSDTFEHLLNEWHKKLRPKVDVEFYAGIEFTYRKSLKLAQAAQASKKDDVYHHCRKWVKYYLYQLRLVVPKKRIKDSEHLKQIATLGSILGDFHDYCVLEYTINDLLIKSEENNDVAFSSLKEEGRVLPILVWLGERKKQKKVQSLKLFKKIFVNRKPAIKIK